MNIHSYKAIHFSGMSAAKFRVLLERLGHATLSVTKTDKGFRVAGPDLAGDIAHDPATETLTVELHEIPSMTTPGYFLGRLYDELLSIPQS